MKKWLFPLIFCLLLLLFAGCDEGRTEENESEFASAVPEFSLVELSISESDTVVFRNGTSSLRKNMVSLMDRINGIAKEIHDSMTVFVASDEEPLKAIFEENSCRIWIVEEDSIEWKLRVCRKDKIKKRYSFLLVGKKKVEGDIYKPVAAGYQTILPEYSGGRRGTGFVGYNLKNYGELTSLRVGGNVGIGFRYAGKVQQLTMGLKDFETIYSEEPVTSLYRYRRVMGKGGTFRYIRKNDILKKTAEDVIVVGEDDIPENMSVAAGWTISGSGKAVSSICSGSLGNGNCIWWYHCWETDGTRAFDELVEEKGVTLWTGCPDLQSGELDPMNWEEVPLPETEESSTGAPSVDIPEKDPEE